MIENLDRAVQPFLYTIAAHGVKRGGGFCNELRGELVIGARHQLGTAVDLILLVALQRGDRGYQFFQVGVTGKRAGGELLQVLLDTQAVENVLARIVAHG